MRKGHKTEIHQRSNKKEPVIPKTIMDMSKRFKENKMNFK